MIVNIDGIEAEFDLDALSDMRVLHDMTLVDTQPLALDRFCRAVFGDGCDAVYDALAADGRCTFQKLHDFTFKALTAAAEAGKGSAKN